MYNGLLKNYCARPLIEYPWGVKNWLPMSDRSGLMHSVYTPLPRHPRRLYGPCLARTHNVFQQTVTAIFLIFVLGGTTQAAETLHDPTRPGGTPTPRAAAEPAAQRWHLSSIVIADTRRVAIINDQVVAIGEQVDGATVMDIQAYAVTLRRDGRDFTLTLLDARVKTHSG